MPDKAPSPWRKERGADDDSGLPTGRAKTSPPASPSKSAGTTQAEAFDSISSSASSVPEDYDADAEDEAYPYAFAILEWQLASGARGKLHFVKDEHQALRCGRVLWSPELGAGLALAANAGREWSPRCWNALPEAARAWWSDSTNVFAA